MKKIEKGAKQVSSQSFAQTVKQECLYVSLNPKAAGHACALLWGTTLLLTGLFAYSGSLFANDFLNIMMSIYPFYDPTSSFFGVLLGGLYGLIDGFVCGYVVAWLYNRCNK